MSRIPTLRVVSDSSNPPVSSPQQARTNPPGGMPEGAESLIVLSRDAALIDTLEVIGFPHDVVAVSREADLTGSLTTAPAAVALLDAAAVTKSIERVTEELKAQFPDIVLIVAGGPRDQAALAPQITQGMVYRFLAKPVSPQRIKLFLDAAWRRRGEQQTSAYSSSAYSTSTYSPGSEFITTRPKPQLELSRAVSRPSIWLISVIAAAAVLIGWAAIHFLGRTPDTRTDTASTEGTGGLPSTAPAEDAAAIKDLLQRADLALGRGAYVSPPHENARELYTQVQRLSPNNARAAQGLEKTLQGVLNQAQTALQDKHLDEAEGLTKQAWDLEPDNPQVSALLTQIAAARSNQTTNVAGAPAPTPATPAAAAQRPERSAALAPPQRERPAATGAPAPAAPSPAPVEQRQAELERGKPGVADLLRKAQEHLRQGILVDPPDNSARSYLAQARTLAPNDPAVRQAEKALLDAVAAQAHRAVLANRPDDAEKLIVAAAELGARPEDLSNMRSELRQRAIVNRAESLFQERMGQGRLVDPAEDSAKYYLTQLMRSEPNNPGTQVAQQAFGDRTLLEASTAIRTRDFDNAQRWLREAADAGVAPARVASMQGDLRAAQQQAASSASTAAAASSPVAPSTPLTRTHFVNPVYPSIAIARALGGYVVVQFTVKPDGETSDIVVTEAVPAGIFDKAATDAVRQWRYQPFKGQQPQPAKIKIPFHLQDAQR